VNRRRLAAFAGAIGLLGAFFSSGVAARADTAISDATFNTMVSNYVAMATSVQGVCLGVPQANDGTCPNIVQSSTDQNNVAVCVEHDTMVDENCVIDQTSVSGHNIAIVVQFFSKNQTANQSASITQRNGDGSDLAAIVQIAKQSIQSAGTQKDDQEATISQSGNLLPADAGRNLTILHQSSTQFGQSGTMDQQIQTSIEHGSVFQNRGGVSRAHADQSQSQTLKGLGAQFQTIDPRCCAFQRNNPMDDVSIAQQDSMFADHPASQHSSTIGKCDSSGHCGIDQNASVNGTSLHEQVDCTGKPCSSGIACSTAGCQPCVVVIIEGTPSCMSSTAPVAFNNPGTDTGRWDADLAAWWSTGPRPSTSPSARFTITAALLA
jgi:hypothetical protein